MLAERFLVNMFLKMSCFPGLGKFFLPKIFFGEASFFMVCILIIILISGNIFLKLRLNIMLNY